MALFDTREKKVLGVVVGGGIVFVGLMSYFTAKKASAQPALESGAVRYGVKCNCATGTEIVDQGQIELLYDTQYLEALNAKVTDPWAITKRIYTKICPGCTQHPATTKFPSEALVQFYIFETIVSRLQESGIITGQQYNAYVLEGAAWAVKNGIEWSKILPDVGMPNEDVPG